MRKSSIALTMGLAIGLGGESALASSLSDGLQVYDSKGQIGTLEQSGLFVRQYGKDLYSLVLDNQGLQVNALFLYTTANCTGKAYAFYIYDGIRQPKVASYDGHDIWTSDANFQVINAQSYSWDWDWATAKVKPQCFAYPYQAVVTNPVKIDTAPQWAPSCDVTNVTLPAYGYTVAIHQCRPVLTVK